MLNSILSQVQEYMPQEPSEINLLYYTAATLGTAALAVTVGYVVERKRKEQARRERESDLERQASRQQS